MITEQQQKVIQYYYENIRDIEHVKIDNVGSLLLCVKKKYNAMV